MAEAQKKKITGFLSATLDMVKTRFKGLPFEYKAIREKMQNLTQTNTDLGFRHLQRGNLADAVMRFKLVLRFSPDYIPALYGMGLCRMEEGNHDEAARLFRKAIGLNGGTYPEAEYHLALVDNTVIPAVIPIQVTKDYFNRIAPNFNEEYLGNLHYQGPALLVEAVVTVLKDKKDLTLLDLGCGTGLCGKEFKENKLAKTVIGVDNASQMAKQARLLKFDYRPVYDTVIEQDYHQYLENPAPSQAFDVILAGLSFHAERNLAPLLDACKRYVLPGGIIAFTACKAKEKEVEFMPATRNFAFSLSYLESQAQKAGLTSVHIKEALLYEGCQGYVCVFVNS